MFDEKLHFWDLTSLKMFGFIISVCVPAVVSGLLHYTSTDMGTIIGKLEKTHFRDKTYQYVSYLGIPYAEESFDFWRFRKPRVPKRFEQPYNATQIRPSCLQTGFGRTRQKTSENCLYLNIFAPSESTINPTKTFPVLIYIHGGDFKVGSMNDVAPEVLSAYGKIIVVTINYRLGVFGFLSSGDGVASGNYGLWDQHFAIRWIRYNIASFGGDVENITLLGHTAGAASAMYQGLYPGNRGLFHRIIAINGNSRSPWAINEPNAKLIGKQLDCMKYMDEFRDVDNDTVIECIKDTPSHRLLKVGAELNNIGPTVDGEFLTDHPAKLLMPNYVNGSDAYDFFRSLDIIIGYNEHNGDILLHGILRSKFNKTDIYGVEIKRNEFELILIPKLLLHLYKTFEALHDTEVSFDSAKHAQEVVNFYYSNWTDPTVSKDMIKSLQQISYELNFFIPSLIMCDSHFDRNNNASTYMFRFDYSPVFEIWDSPWLSRVGVGLETLFVFGLPTRMTQELKLQRKDFTEWDILLAENFMRWISSFARTGDPNKPSPILSSKTTPAWNHTTGTWSKHPMERKTLTWPHYDVNRTFITFSTNMTKESIKKQPGEPHTTFWLRLIPALLRDVNIEVMNIPAGIPDDVEPFLTGIDIPRTEARSVIIGLVAVSGGLLISIIAIVCYVCKVFC